MAMDSVAPAPVGKRLVDPQSRRRWWLFGGGVYDVEEQIEIVIDVPLR